MSPSRPIFEFQGCFVTHILFKPNFYVPSISVPPRSILNPQSSHSKHLSVFCTGATLPVSLPKMQTPTPESTVPMAFEYDRWIKEWRSGKVFSKAGLLVI